MKITCKTNNSSAPPRAASPRVTAAVPRGKAAERKLQQCQLPVEKLNAPQGSCIKPMLENM